MEEKFICTNCNTVWIRNAHYKAILQAQNLINTLMGNKQIIDMCGKCNHFVKED